MLGTFHEAPDGRFAIRFDRQIPQPPEQIWPYITDPAKLPAWLIPAQVDLTGPTGTELSFVFPDGRAPTLIGRNLASSHPALLEFTWGAEVIRWDLTPNPQGGTEIVFTNVFPNLPSAAPVAAAWHAALDVLEARLDDRDIDWDPWKRAEALTADYDEAFSTN